MAVQDQVEQLPEVNINKYAVDKRTGTKWVTVEGLEKLLKPYFPGLNKAVVEQALVELYEAGALDYEPQLVKYFERTSTYRTYYGISELYKLSTYKQVARYLLAEENEPA